MIRARPLTSLLACIALLSGCANRPRLFTHEPLRDRYEAPLAPMLGAIVAHFPSTQSVVIELHPAWSGPPPPAGRVLESRDPQTGVITARLELARPRRLPQLAAIIADGTPRLGDDVVLLPPSASGDRASP